MGIIRKIISGDKLHKSRFHDEKHNFIGWPNMVKHTIPAVSSGLLRLTIDYRPELPWIGYDGIKILEKQLDKSKRVLEFGSGMSTVWYSKMAGEVCSVEHFEPWYNKVTEIIKSKGIENIKYAMHEDLESYSTFMQDDEDGFDLIMVDGSFRSDCVKNATKLLRQGGILYLDNSDKDSTPSGGDMRLAEQYAREFAEEKSAEIIEITDFAPTQLFVQQGLLVITPK